MKVEKCWKNVFLCKWTLFRFITFSISIWHRMLGWPLCVCVCESVLYCAMFVSFLPMFISIFFHFLLAIFFLLDSFIHSIYLFNFFSPCLSVSLWIRMCANICTIRDTVCVYSRLLESAWMSVYMYSNHSKATHRMLYFVVCAFANGHSESFWSV